MPGPLKCPGKFWNIDAIWGYILLILETNLCILNLIILSIWQNFFAPPPFVMGIFLVPSPSGNSKLFAPHFTQLPPTKLFMNTPLAVVSLTPLSDVKKATPFSYWLNFNECGMSPLLVLVSPCFRENAVVTCKIGSLLCSLVNLLQKNVTVFFFEN